MSRTTRRGRTLRRCLRSRTGSPPVASIARSVRSGSSGPRRSGRSRSAGLPGGSGRSNASSSRRCSRSAAVRSPRSRWRSTSRSLAATRSWSSSSVPAPCSMASCCERGHLRRAGLLLARAPGARLAVGGEPGGERLVVAGQVVGLAAQREPARPVDLGRLGGVEVAHGREERLSPGRSRRPCPPARSAMANPTSPGRGSTSIVEPMMRPRVSPREGRPGPRPPRVRRPRGT